MSHLTPTSSRTHWLRTTLLAAAAACLSINAGRASPEAAVRR